MGTDRMTLYERLLEAFMQTMMGSGRLAAEIAYNTVLNHRDELFGPGNDEVWGAGNWMRCDQCIDHLGLPSYHHVSVHSGP